MAYMDDDEDESELRSGPRLTRLSENVPRRGRRISEAPGMNQPKSIMRLAGELQERINVLAKTLEELESRILPILVIEGRSPKDDEKESPDKILDSALSTQLDDMISRVHNITRQVDLITERVQL